MSDIENGSVPEISPSGNDTENGWTPDPAERCSEIDIKSDSHAKKSSLSGDFFDIFEIFILSTCMVLLFFSFFTRLCRVDGPSMENTLINNEMLVISDLFYTPKYGDVIVFHQTSTTVSRLNEPVVKRVIATEKQWIDIKVNDNILIVTVYDENMENPRVLTEDYAKYSSSTASLNRDNTYPMQIPAGHVFVMGDNRNNSTDSRSHNIGDVNGCVDVRRILGKVIFRVSPFSKFGPVD